MPQVFTGASVFQGARFVMCPNVADFANIDPLSPEATQKIAEALLKSGLMTGSAKVNEIASRLIMQRREAFSIPEIELTYPAGATFVGQDLHITFAED